MDVRLAVADALLADAASLRRLAHSLLAPDEADDVIQATCVAALSRPAAVLRHPGLWLRGTVRKLALKARRSSTRRQAHERLAALSETHPHDPPSLAMQAEAVRDVGIAVHALEEPFRSAVLLRFWHDLPVDAIAARLGVPRNTVRSRLQRGLARLRERLDREHGTRERWAAPLAALVPLRVAAVGGLLCMVLVMKTKLLFGAAAILMAAVAIPWLLRDPPADGGPIKAKDKASIGAQVAAVAPERQEAVAPASEPAAPTTTPAPFDPAPVPVEPWLARFLVVNEKHEAIADAAITLWAAKKIPGDMLSQRTGTNVTHTYHGRDGEPLFALRSDALGRASLRLEHEAYVVLAASPGLADSGEIPLFAPRSAAGETTLVLKVPLLIRGLVLRIDGSPAASAIVTTRTNSLRRYQSTTTADGDGRFEVKVAEDSYLLRAELDGARTFEDWVYVRRGIPCEVTLRFPGAYTLEGEVIDDAGKPVAGAKVMTWCEFHLDRTLRTQREDERSRASSGTDGRFTIQVRRLARYQVVASADGLANSELVWTATTAAEPHPFTRLQLRAFTTITGIVRVESGKPLGGRKVIATPETDLQTGIVSSPGEEDAFARCEPAVAGPDGLFALRVQPGVAWHVFTRSTGSFGTRIASLRNVKPDTANVELVVPDALLVHSRVQGRVVRESDGSPVTGFTVWLARVESDQRPSFSRCRPEVTDNEFFLRDLPSGCRYVLQVEPAEAHIADWAPARLDPFTSSATTATELKIRVPGWGELPIRIVPAEGEDLVGITCGIGQDIMQNRARGAHNPDHEGRISIKSIPPGAYPLNVRRNVYERIWEQEVLVRAGLNPEVVVNLPKQAK